MQAGNATGLRRFVAPSCHRARLPRGELLPEARPHPRRGLLRHDVLRRPPGDARHLRRVGRRGGAERRPPGEARPEHRARRDRRRHPAHRPRRHLLDHLLLAVPRRPDVRHARPPLRRARRLERRHLGERQRGAELRRRRRTSATTSATTGPTSSSRRRTGLWDTWDDDALVLDREAGVFADPSKVHELDHKGEWFDVRGPLTVPRVAAGPAGAAAGRLVGSGPGLRGALGRGDLHRRPRHRGRPLPLPGPEGAHRRARARPGHGEDAADGVHGGRRVRRPTPRSASSCS